MKPNLNLVSKILYLIILGIVIYIAVQFLYANGQINQIFNTSLLIVAVILVGVRLWLRHNLKKSETKLTFS